MLKLERPAVVHSITFGKYHKIHVCNLKEFRVLGGPSPSRLTELLHAGLRNDSEPETFSLKRTVGNDSRICLPVQYLKIVPIAAHGANFNYSIWYVSLTGVIDPDAVSALTAAFDEWQARAALRLCAKHLRQLNLMSTFDALAKETGLQLESEHVTSLYEDLVRKGDFDQVELDVETACARGDFAEHIASQQYRPSWKRMHPEGTQPGPRGGHQMIHDPERDAIYLFGGWDGAKDLADFWRFDLATQTWSVISSNTSAESGPGPRSCHKMVLDSATGTLYTLGRYVDPKNREEDSLVGDLYSFDLNTKTWTVLSRDTESDGGPSLVYDHQMCFEPASRVMYVFGGRIIDKDQARYGSSSDIKYSGLYAFAVDSGTWTLLRSDANLADESTGAIARPDQIRSRIGHSMLLAPNPPRLLIFAGQRHKSYLSDFYLYHIDEDRVQLVSADASGQGGPEAGFTQRATLDEAAGEVYVLSGLVRERSGTRDSVKNTLWVYNLARDEWSSVYSNGNLDPSYWEFMSESEPVPRFAHQLVLDTRRQVHYLMGGNPGGDDAHPNSPKMRLDDFWALSLVKPSAEALLRKCKFLIRRQRYLEMARDSTKAMDALRYLQTTLSEVVNHDDKDEAAEFQTLATALFNDGSPLRGPSANLQGLSAPPILLPGSKTPDGDSTPAGRARHAERIGLFQALLTYFPESSKEPAASLLDVLPM